MSIYFSGGPKNYMTNPKTGESDAQELQAANEDEAERKAVADLNYPDDTSHQWPRDPSASPSRSNLEFYQRRGE
jgi:hypothetical protein